MSTQVRAPRADAARNRDRLLEVAANVFTEYGVDASLERIAREAGVGIGTLYRHFPTRDALVEAVYRHGVESLAEDARELARTLSPVDALAAFMRRFVLFVPSKRGLAPYLKSVLGADSELFRSSQAQIKAIVDELVAAAAAAGQIRPGVDGMSVLRGLSGACLMADTSSVPAANEQTLEVAELLMDGLRYGAPASS